MRTCKGKVIVILGTTASGKTRLAVDIARKFNGEIISADSRQVYRGMDIGTGKDLAEYKIQNPNYKCQIKSKIQKISYHLIDVITPKKQFTVAEFQKRAYEAIEEILRRDKLPIICGGTGLYIDAIIKGYKLGIRNQELGIREGLDKLSLERLLSKLKKIDSKTYRIIDKKNRRRVQRALEIYYETGIPKSKQLAPNPPPYEFLKIGITFPKNILAKRIEKRLHQRLEQGMINEVKKLKRRRVSWKRLDDFGLEYRWVSRYLRGLISRDEMEKQLAKEIVHFAKRQITWFKRDKEIIWIKNEKEAILAVRAYLH